MKNLSLLDLPFAGTRSFTNFFNTHSNEPEMPVSGAIGADKSSTQYRLGIESPQSFHDVNCREDYRAKGMFLTDPAIRLARAYLVLLESGHIKEGFRAFYCSRERVNQYTQALASVSLCELGFVGVDQYVNLSVMLLAQYFQKRHPIGSIALQPNDMAAKQLLDKDTLNEISALNDKDYKLYNEAIELTRQAYFASCPSITDNLASDKNVIIHVGPPKTGSSSIQALLSNQIDNLRSQGFYYPVHDLDRNAISSGNFLSILAKNENTLKYEFCKAKSQKLINKFLTRAEHTLLLSSEIFSNNLVALLSQFRAATFIYYVRYPASEFESGYHQQVKRHGWTNPFKLPSKLRLLRLEQLLQLASELDVKVEVRFFDREINDNKGLLEDFVETINFDCPQESLKMRVNPRLGFEELELIRFCNNFLETDQLHHLEQTLQKDSMERPRFTLISSTQLKDLNAGLAKEVENLVSKFPLIGRDSSFFDRLQALSKQSVNYPFTSQIETAVELERIWLQLKSNHIETAYGVYKSQRKMHDNKKGALRWGVTDYSKLLFTLLNKNLQRLRLKLS